MKSLPLAVLFALSVLLAPVSVFAQSPSPGKSPAKKKPFSAYIPDNRGAELDRIKARAESIAPNISSRDPEARKRAQADLAPVSRDLQAWAKKYGVQLERQIKTRSPKGTAAEVQTCDSVFRTSDDKVCVLYSSHVDRNGRLHCVYDCAPVNAPTPKPNL